MSDQKVLLLDQLQVQRAVADGLEEDYDAGVVVALDFSGVPFSVGHGGALERDFAVATPSAFRASRRISVAEAIWRIPTRSGSGEC